MEVRRGLKKGPYVEFNISGNERRYRHWENESLYLDEAVFSVFAGCFDRSVDNFSYFGPTKYRRDDLLKLRRELGTTDSGLAAITGMDPFVGAIAKLTRGEAFIQELGKMYKLTTEWDEVLGLLRKANRALLDLVNQCVREGRVLWVLGV